VLDVPAKLAVRARVSGTGQGRKTDPADAHATVMVALRDKGLREVRADPELTVLRLLCDRRDELSKAQAQALNRMHRLFPCTGTRRRAGEEVRQPVQGTAGHRPAP
jgi:transposase